MHVSKSPDCIRNCRTQGISRGNIPDGIGAKTKNWICPICKKAGKTPKVKKVTRRNTRDAGDEVNKEEIDDEDDLVEDDDLEEDEEE
jgi:hypothetical protein